MSIFDQMLGRYDIITENDRKNAIYEVIQEITLGGLYRGGFFNKAAFYGGTCLRIFHGIDRFSEDMDFSLIKSEPDFKLEDYFSAIQNEFEAVGRDVEITKKDKKQSSKVESAFLKDNTEVYNVSFQTERSIKVKIEVDIDPPLSFDTEQKLMLQPFSFMTRCFVLPDLFAGKMHALVFRNWKNRVKGRDWYDFEWYVKQGVELNLKHLQTRIRQFNNVEMTKEEFFDKLKERISSTNIELVKRDVVPFIKNPTQLDIWSNNYFLQLVEMMKIKANTTQN